MESTQARRKTLAIIGGGNMAEAIIVGLFRNFNNNNNNKSEDLIAPTIYVSEVVEDRRKYLEEKYGNKNNNNNNGKIIVVSDKETEEIVKKSGIILLAVKPYQLDTISHHVGIGAQHAIENQKDEADKMTMIVTILAGVTSTRVNTAIASGFLHLLSPSSRHANGNQQDKDQEASKEADKRMKEYVRVIRVMPNMGAFVQSSISAVSLPGNNDAKAPHVKNTLYYLLSSIGKVVELGEECMDAVTAVSGSGPGYLYYMLQHWINAAVANGIPKDVAPDLVSQTFVGFAELLKRDEFKSPTEMIPKIATPGGTTQAAIDSLNTSDFPNVILKAVTDSTNRSRQLNSGTK